jgi:hypothetical protein
LANLNAAERRRGTSTFPQRNQRGRSAPYPYFPRRFLPLHAVLLETLDAVIRRDKP